MLSPSIHLQIYMYNNILTMPKRHCGAKIWRVQSKLHAGSKCMRIRRVYAGSIRWVRKIPI